MMFMWLFLLGDTSAISLRSQVVTHMGLDKPFAGFTMTTTDDMTVGALKTKIETVEWVDACSPRWARSSPDGEKIEGYDGQRAWQSESLKAALSGVSSRDDETKRRKAIYEWHLNLIILLTNTKLQPLSISEPGGRLGLRFLNNDDGSLLADIYLTEGLPGEVRYYGEPDPNNGEQRLTINRHSDYRTIEGRKLPYHIVVEDSVAKTLGKTIELEVNVQAWSFYEEVDPKWFQLEP